NLGGANLTGLELSRPVLFFSSLLLSCSSLGRIGGHGITPQLWQREIILRSWQRETTRWVMPKRNVVPIVKYASTKTTASGRAKRHDADGPSLASPAAPFLGHSSLCRRGGPPAVLWLTNHHHRLLISGHAIKFPCNKAFPGVWLASHVRGVSVNRAEVRLQS